jgi:hypothetical protein
MPGGKTTRSDGKYPHAKVIRLVFLADNDSAGDTFDSFAVKFKGRGIFIVHNFHNSLIVLIILENGSEIAFTNNIAKFRECNCLR